MPCGGGPDSPTTPTTTLPLPQGFTWHPLPVVKEASSYEVDDLLDLGAGRLPNMPRLLGYGPGEQTARGLWDGYKRWKTMVAPTRLNWGRLGGRTIGYREDLRRLEAICFWWALSHVVSGQVMTAFIQSVDDMALGVSVQEAREWIWWAGAQINVAYIDIMSGELVQSLPGYRGVLFVTVNDRGDEAPHWLPFEAVLELHHVVTAAEFTAALDDARTPGERDAILHLRNRRLRLDAELEKAEAELQVEQEEWARALAGPDALPEEILNEVHLTEVADMCDLEREVRRRIQQTEATRWAQVMADAVAESRHANVCLNRRSVLAGFGREPPPFNADWNVWSPTWFKVGETTMAPINSLEQPAPEPWAAAPSSSSWFNPTAKVAEVLGGVMTNFTPTWTSGSWSEHLTWLLQVTSRDPTRTGTLAGGLINGALQRLPVPRQLFAPGEFRDAYRGLGWAPGMFWELRESVLVGFGACINTDTLLYHRDVPVDPRKPERLVNGCYNPAWIKSLATSSGTWTIREVQRLVIQGSAYRIYAIDRDRSTLYSKLCRLNPFVWEKVSAVHERTLEEMVDLDSLKLVTPTADADRRTWYTLYEAFAPKALVGVYRDNRNEEMSQETPTGVHPGEVFRSVLTAYQLLEKRYGNPGFGVEE